MVDLSQRPFVFLDVDGLLIPMRSRRVVSAHRWTDGPAQPSHETGNPLLDRLDPEDGRRLLALGCPWVWATTWMGEANEVIAPRLGLPALPVVEWPDVDDQPGPGLHWKTAPLVRWAAGRPFVWLDDEITDSDRRWVATHHPARTLLHRVDPYVGLTAPDFAHIGQWLDDHLRSP